MTKCNLKALEQKHNPFRGKVREPFKNVLADFFRPPHPLNGKSFCQKTLSGKGGYLPPHIGPTLAPEAI